MDRGNKASPGRQQSQYIMNEALQQPENHHQPVQQKAPAAYHLLYVDRNTAWPLFRSGKSTIVGYVRMIIITCSILQFAIALGGLVFTNLQEYISIPTILNSAYLIMLATIGMCVSIRRNDQSTIIFAMLCIFNAVVVVTILTHNTMSDKPANMCILPQRATGSARYRSPARRPTTQNGPSFGARSALINVTRSQVCDCRSVYNDCLEFLDEDEPLNRCCEHCIARGRGNSHDDYNSIGDYLGSNDSQYRPGTQNTGSKTPQISGGDDNEEPATTENPTNGYPSTKGTTRATTKGTTRETTTTTTTTRPPSPDKKDYSGIMKAFLWSSIALDIVLASLALLLAVCTRNDPLVPEPSKTASTSSGQGPTVLVTTLPATVNTRQETRLDSGGSAGQTANSGASAVPSQTPHATGQHPPERATTTIYVPPPPTPSSRKISSQASHFKPSQDAKRRKHTSTPSTYGGPPTTVVVARLKSITLAQPQQQQHPHHHHHPHQHEHQNITHQRLIDHLNKRRRLAVQQQRQESVKRTPRDKKVRSPRHKASQRKRSRQSVYTQVGEDRGSKYGAGLGQVVAKSDSSTATAVKSSPKLLSRTKSTISADAVN